MRNTLHFFLKSIFTSNFFIFQFIIGILMLANCTSLKAQDKLTAVKTIEAMSVDGMANEAVWAKASWYTMDQAWLFSLPSTTDFKGKYKLAWDQNYLYLLAEITDDVLSDMHTEPLTNYWDDDCVEIFLDENRSKGPHNGNYNAWAYHVSLTGDVVDDGPHLYNDHINMARTKNGNVYTWEFKIKIFGDNFVYGANNTPLTLTDGKIMGFSLAYCDNDGGQSREGFIGSGVVPGADKNVGYLTADYFQELTLSSGVTPPCTANNIGATIEAENWCKMSGVQTEVTTDTGAGSNVGWIDANDWLSYAINVPVAGQYKISYRVASQSGGGSIQLKNGSAIINTIPVNATGSWQTWLTIDQPVTLPAGTTEFTVFAAAGGFNFNWFKVESLLVVPVSGLSISPTSLSLIVGNTQQITPSITPSNAANKMVSYTSSNTSIASVSSTGLVTAVGIGSVVITATTQDGGFTATSSVSVSNVPVVKVTGISLSPSTVSLLLGSTQQLTATITPTNAANKTVSYTSSNTAIASVSTTGLITALGTGSVVITATTQDGGFSATCSVTCVTTGCTVNNIETTIEAENWCKMNGVQTEVTSDAGAGSNVGWIDANDWLSYTINVPVGGSYNISYRVASQSGGGNIQLKNGSAIIVNTPVNATGSWQTWTTINQPVTLPAGVTEYTLFATTGGFNFNWFKIESLVVTPVSGLSVSPTSLALFVGNTQQLTATVSPVNAANKNVSYVSSNTSIASVSSTGLVTALNTGSATITVTTQDGGFTASSNITVSAAPVVHVTGVSLSTTSASICVGQSLTIIASVLPSNANDKSVNWTSSNSSIVTVANGVATGNVAGTANICAISNDGQISACASITITNCGTSLQIEAETYSYKTSNPKTEACSDTNGGLNMGYIGNADFMNYIVNVPNAGVYTLSYRVASASSTGKIIFGKGGVDLTPAIAVQSTGGWQVWKTISTPVTLAAGSQTFTVYAQAGGFNLNWWSISNIKSAELKSSDLELNKESLKIYPNPASTDGFNISISGFESLENVTVQIYSLTGQQVYNKQQTVDSNGNQTIDNLLQNQLISGVYIVKVSGKSQSIQSKLIINN